MKIKLIRMPSFIGFDCGLYFNAPSVVPLSIGLIASSLRNNGFNVDIDDLNIKYHRGDTSEQEIFLDFNRAVEYVNGKQDHQLENLIKSILSKTSMDGYDVFLLSFEDDYPSNSFKSIFLSFCYYIKKTYGIPIIVGGIWSGYSDLMNNFRDNDVVDYLISGYGEGPIVDLLRSLNNADLEQLDTKGLVFEKGQYKDQSRNESYDFTILPDYDGLPLHLYSRRFNDRLISILPYKLNTGCIGRCAFCSKSGQAKNTLQLTHPKKAVEHLKALKNKYMIPNFIFLDTTFNQSKRFIVDFCETLLENNLKIYWTDCARFDTHTLNGKMLRLMREAGCVNLLFGLETGSSKMLKFINKDINLEGASDILKMSSRAGIWNGIELIAGLPHEKESDIKDSLDFVNANKNYIDEYWLNAFTLRKTSTFCMYPEKFGIKNIRPDYSDNYKGFGKGLDSKRINFQFDEINGLRWKDKKVQINNSFEKMKSGLKVPEHMLFYDHLPALFYLYSKHNDKDVIKKEYLKMKRNMIFKMMQRPDFLYRQIRSITTPKILMSKLKNLI